MCRRCTRDSGNSLSAIACMHCMRVSDAGRKRYLQRGDCVKLLKDARGVERGDIGGKVESKHNSRRPVLSYAAVRWAAPHRRLHPILEDLSFAFATNGNCKAPVQSNADKRLTCMRRNLGKVPYFVFVLLRMIGAGNNYSGSARCSRATMNTLEELQNMFHCVSDRIRTLQGLRCSQFPVLLSRLERA